MFVRVCAYVSVRVPICVASWLLLLLLLLCFAVAAVVCYNLCVPVCFVNFVSCCCCFVLFWGFLFVCLFLFSFVSLFVVYLSLTFALLKFVCCVRVVICVVFSFCKNSYNVTLFIFCPFGCMCSVIISCQLRYISFHFLLFVKSLTDDLLLV